MKAETITKEKQIEIFKANEYKKIINMKVDNFEDYIKDIWNEKKDLEEKEYKEFSIQDHIRYLELKIIKEIMSDKISDLSTILIKGSTWS